MKTKRFYIEFTNLEVDMSTMIEITGQEYENQLKHLNTQMEEEHEFEMTHTTYQDDCTSYTQQRDHFRYQGAVTTLYKQICKEGYRFKTKEELNKEK